ncbi:hypothetical protein MKW98_001467, partial [Papaver atlanticum]
MYEDTADKCRNAWLQYLGPYQVCPTIFLVPEANSVLIREQKKPRLVEAKYFCELNTPTEYLSSMWRARVLKEEMQQGSSLFTDAAHVPVTESHWEELSKDPFFEPKTEEEIEEFGDSSSHLWPLKRINQPNPLASRLAKLAAAASNCSIFLVTSGEFDGTRTVKVKQAM